MSSGGSGEGGGLHYNIGRDQDPPRQTCTDLAPDTIQVNIAQHNILGREKGDSGVTHTPYSWTTTRIAFGECTSLQTSHQVVVDRTISSSMQRSSHVACGTNLGGREHKTGLDDNPLASGTFPGALIAIARTSEREQRWFVTICFSCTRSGDLSADLLSRFQKSLRLH